MKLFFKNALAVLLLQPGAFVVPHPRTLRLMAFAASSLATLVVSYSQTSLGQWMWIAAGAALAVTIKLSSAALNYAGPGSAYGPSPVARAVFACACTIAVGTVLAEVAESGIITLLLAAYVHVAMVLQLPASPRSEMLSDAERAGARDARAALDAQSANPVALAAHGKLALRELGPPCASWKGQPIFEWIVDVHGRRWIFEQTTGGSTVPTDDQLVMPPGALYRQHRDDQ